MKRELGELRVFGRYGQKYLHRPFFERSTFEVDLLSPVPMFHELRFVVESTGSARRNDSRILDFRVLAMAVDEIPGDVLPLGSGCFAGCGWHKLERSGTELFRWAETGAQIAASYANVPSVALEIEGGPGVAYRPFDLDVTTSSGKQIGTYRISGRSSRRDSVRHAIPANADAAKRSIRHIADGCAYSQLSSICNPAALRSLGNLAQVSDV